jgi:secondary thiamine-phosphate synthase enzyme
MRLRIRTTKDKQVLDITERLNEAVRGENFRQGLCHLFVLHSTAALTTADLDPGTDLDMLDAFTDMIPKRRYRHPHDPAHVGDHILSSLIGPSLIVPVEAGRLLLGTWQRVVLVEFDGPREREIEVRLASSPAD